MMLKRRPLCIFVLLVIVVLSILHALRIPLQIRPAGDDVAENMAEAGESAYLVGIVERTEEREEYSICVLGSVRLLLPDEKQSLPVSRIRLMCEEGIYYPSGYCLTVRGPFSTLPEATNPGQFDSRLYYRVQDIGFQMKRPTVTVEKRQVNPLREGLLVIRSRLKARLNRVYSARDAGILSAMMLGEKSLLEDEDKTAWQMGGISHMLAISGLHLTLIGMGLFQAFRRIGIRLSISAGMAMGVLVVYAVFTGCSISTMRALIMFLLAMGAPLVGRTYDMMTALAAAVLLLLLDNPYYLFYTGFQLSVSAVLICCLFQKRSKATVAYMLYLGMLPLVLTSYFEMPLYSMLINFFAVPLLPVILAAGSVGCIIGHPIAGLPAALCLRVIRLMLKLSQRLPYASIIIGKPTWQRIVCFYVLLAGWTFLMKQYRNYKRRVPLFCLSVGLVMILAFRIPNRLTMTFIDVGQGDGCLVECPNGAHFLVDGGSSGVKQVGQYRVLPCIKAEGVRTLDYVILTHMDSDHINGIREILELIGKHQTSLRIKTVIVPYLREKGEAYREMVQLAEAAGCRVVAVESGDQIGIGEVKLEFLNPDPSIEGGAETDENGQCVVTALHYRAFDALLTGDVHGAGEEHVLSELKKRTAEYEVLKVAHHGSRLSTPQEFLDELRPKVSIISVGANNRYGHPGEELLKRLQSVHTRIYRTDQSGAVTVQSDGRGYRVEEYLPSDQESQKQQNS